MKLYYSPKVTGICSVLVTLMLVASFWQYQRFVAKQAYIKVMEQRLREPVVKLETLAEDPTTDWSQYYYRRVKVSGQYEFDQEMALRNRRYQGLSGIFALTPLKLDGLQLNGPTSNGTPPRVLVSRGFIPVARSDRDTRRVYQKEQFASFIGLVKESSRQKWLAPPDPKTGLALPWADQWLRVDLPKMAQQLPYPLLPIYLEVMETGDSKGVEEQIVFSTAGRDELFFLPGKEAQLSGVKDLPDLNYPIPIFDTVIPPGRHFGYIFEWAIMAFVTVLAGIVLQLKPRREQMQ